MKKTATKIIALLSAMILGVSLLSACGGGDGGGTSDEANAGVREVVITVPDGWTVNAGTDDAYLSFTSEDSDCILSLSATNSADLGKSREYDDSITTTDIKEFYKQSCEEYEKAVKEGEMDCSDIEICDTDGKYGKMKHENGYVSLDATWLLNDNVYQLLLFDQDNSAYENGNGAKDAPDMLSNDEIAMFEGVLASANTGDGDALLKSLLITNTIGEYMFAMPAGYRVKTFGDNHLILEKDGSEANITMSITTEEDLNVIEDENGNHPASLEDAWKSRIQGLPEENLTEIAGNEGAMYEFPEKDGKYYNVSAAFLGEDGIYNLSMETDVWDRDGSIKPDAKELTKEDITIFENFVESFSAK